MRTALRRFWDAWKELASYIGNFQARLLLTVFYFTVAVPFALIVRAADLLRVRERPQSSRWIARETGPDSLEAARRQS